MLRPACFALVHSAADYYAPAWCSHPPHWPCHHINDALWTVIGCLRPTPADNLPIVAGIQSVELCCKGAKLSSSKLKYLNTINQWSFYQYFNVKTPCTNVRPPIVDFLVTVLTLPLARYATEPGHLLNPLTCPPGGNVWHLKSSYSFAPAAQQLNSWSCNNRSAALWADHCWNAEWLDNTTRLRTFIPDIDTYLPGIALSGTSWVRLNRLASRLHIWGMAPSAACECGAEEQTVDLTMLSFTVQSFDLPTQCMAWRFWMTRQSNDCSLFNTSPRSSAALQLITRTGSNDEVGKKSFQLQSSSLERNIGRT